MTFLEFVCEKLLGPPAFYSGDSAYWLCPFHEESNPSFHTLPPKPEFKDRFKCWSCGAWGDEFDLLQNEMPRLDYSDRVAWLEQSREEYDRQTPVDISPCGDSWSTIDDPQAVAQAFAALHAVPDRPVPSWAAEDRMMALCRLLAHSADVAWSHDVTLDSLAGYAANFVAQKRDPIEFAERCNGRDK